LNCRCVVPAEAFYEWVGTKRKRQPLHISRRGGKFLSLAGLYSYWKPEGSEGRPIPTFTLVTVEPNQWMAQIHNRMPAILPDDGSDLLRGRRLEDMARASLRPQREARVTRVAPQRSVVEDYQPPETDMKAYKVESFSFSLPELTPPESVRSKTVPS